MFAIGYLSRRAFWQFLCEFSIQFFQLFRESLIFACVLRHRFAHFWKVHAQITVRASKRPLALKCLNWQTLHEFSLNTDINVCCSGLTCAQAPSAPGWWRNKCSYSNIHSHGTRVNGLSTFFHPCCCNVLCLNVLRHKIRLTLYDSCKISLKRLKKARFPIW